MLLILAFLGLLSWCLAAVSITAVVLGVLPTLSTGKRKGARTVEKPVDIRRWECTVCGAHAFRPLNT